MLVTHLTAGYTHSCSTHSYTHTPPIHFAHIHSSMVKRRGREISTPPHYTTPPYPTVRHYRRSLARYAAHKEDGGTRIPAATGLFMEDNQEGGVFISFTLLAKRLLEEGQDESKDNMVDWMKDGGGEWRVIALFFFLFPSPRFI